jgi:hypothetical protein
MEQPIEDQEPLSAIMADIVWLAYEAAVLHDRDFAEVMEYAFEGTELESIWKRPI